MDTKRNNTNKRKAGNELWFLYKENHTRTKNNTYLILLFTTNSESTIIKLIYQFFLKILLKNLINHLEKKNLNECPEIGNTVWLFNLKKFIYTRKIHAAPCHSSQYVTILQNSVAT